MRWWKPIDWRIRYIGTGDFWFDHQAQRVAFDIPDLRDLLPKFTVPRGEVKFRTPDKFRDLPTDPFAR